MTGLDGLPLPEVFPGHTATAIALLVAVLLRIVPDTRCCRRGQSRPDHHPRHPDPGAAPCGRAGRHHNDGEPDSNRAPGVARRRLEDRPRRRPGLLRRRRRGRLGVRPPRRRLVDLGLRHFAGFGAGGRHDPVAGAVRPAVQLSPDAGAVSLLRPIGADQRHHRGRRPVLHRPLCQTVRGRSPHLPRYHLHVEHSVRHLARRPAGGERLRYALRPRRSRSPIPLDLGSGTGWAAACLPACRAAGSTRRCKG